MSPFPTQLSSLKYEKPREPGFLVLSVGLSPASPCSSLLTIGISYADQAAKSLCDSWRPDDIPLAFRTTSQSAFSAPSDGQSAFHQQDIQNHTPPLAHRSTSRNPQLPSPISPSSHTSPFPLPPPAQLLPTPLQHDSSSRHIRPLKGFVHEVVRRSRTSQGVLQTALCYLEAVRMKVPDVLRRHNREGAGPNPDDVAESRIIIGDPDDDGFSATVDTSTSNWDSVPTVRIDDDDEPLPTAPQTQPMLFSPDSDTSSSMSDAASPPAYTPQPSHSLPSPILCPRRTFLACLILASKFMQDRSYSNRAWAKLAGLPPREIGRCERAVGNLLEWRLWVGKGMSVSNRPAMGNRSVTRSRSDGDVLYGSGTAAAVHSPLRSAVPRQASALQRYSTLPIISTTTTTSASQEFSSFPSHPLSQTSSWLGEESNHGGFFVVASPAFTSEPTSQQMQPPFPVANLHQIFVSPPMLTPPLSYSPSASSSSPDEGERTIQMNTVMDLPSPYPAPSSCPSLLKTSHVFLGGNTDSVSFGGSASLSSVAIASKAYRSGSAASSLAPFVYTPSPLSSSPHGTHAVAAQPHWTFVSP